MLVEAFVEIANEHPNWKCVIYGDGDAREKVEAYAIKNNNNQIEFKGRQDNIAEKIKNSSIFVLSSKSEGMPNALMEAMALGLAVIATDCPCGGPKELIEENKNGLLIAVDDKNALKAEIIRLIINKNVREELGKEAYYFMKDYYSKKVCIEWKNYLEGLNK